MLCLRVVSSHLSNWLDLPNLRSIEVGCNAFRFNDNESSTLIMRSDDSRLN